MKLNKNAFSKCILGLLILSFQVGFSQPNIEWQKSYWAETYPTSPQQPGTTIPFLPPPLDQVGLKGYILKELSSEDWFFMHQLSKGTDGKPDGYICGGYSEFIKYKENDRYGCGWTSTQALIGDCNELEVDDYEKGGIKSIICKVDLSGNKIWYKTYCSGNISNIIQTSDGGYLALNGGGQSTEDGNGNLLAYNPGQTLGHVTDYFKGGTTCIMPPDPNSNNNKSHLELIKVDAMGNVQWEYMYGMEPYAGTDGSNAYMLQSSNSGGSGGAGLVETSEGNFIFTAKAEDKMFPGIWRTCVIEVNPMGMWKWGKFYRPTNYNSIGTAIKRIGSGASQSFFISGTEDYETTHAKERAFLFKIDNSASPSPIWTTYFEEIPGTSFQNGAKAGSTLDINSAGELLVPIFKERSGRYAAENGKGFIERVDVNSGLVLVNGETPIGDIVAYDLTVGVVATADGGFAVVSSKRPGPNGSMDGGNSIPAYFPVSSTNPAGCPYNYWVHNDCGASDAYVGKFDAFGNTQWEKIFDSNTNRPPGSPSSWNYPDFPDNRDIRRQECVYSIVQSPDGGFVVAGNNSENYDDCYLVKLESTCTHVVLSNITLPASGSPQSFMYQATDYIHADHVTLIPPSNLDLRAGNEITLSDGFFVPGGGGVFFAVIDPSLDCTPNGMRSSQNTNSDHIISSTNDVKKIDTDELKMSPNPNNGIFAVNFSDNSVKSIYVYNMLGEVVFSKIAFTDQQINVDITEKNNGIYIVKTIEGNSMKTKKVIRQ